MAITTQNTVSNFNQQWNNWLAGMQEQQRRANQGGGSYFQLNTVTGTSTRPSVASRPGSRTTSAAAMPMPQAPTWESGQATSFLNNYLSQMGQINLGTYDFSTSPVTYSPIVAQQVNAEAAVQRAFNFNQSQMSQYGAMAQQMSDIDVQNKERQLDEFVPGWRQSTDKVRAINESYMRGEIPRDIADNLTRSAAFVTAMGGGSAQNQAALTARDLGLTSYQLQQQGMAGTQSYMQMMNQLMPELTTAASVMGSQGMTSQMAVETALQNANRQLQGDMATSAGRLQADTMTQELKLRGAQSAATTGLAQAGFRQDVARTALETQLANLQAIYGSQMNQYQANMQLPQMYMAQRGFGTTVRG